MKSFNDRANLAFTKVEMLLDESSNLPEIEIAEESKIGEGLEEGRVMQLTL